MAIDFHCEHCGKMINAPVESAGKRGKCPHCQNVCYIPSPPSGEDPYDLAPVDDEAERRRKREEDAAHAVQRKLLHERADVDGPDAPATHDNDDMVRPADLRALIADYLAAMGRGHLEEADGLAFALSKNQKEAIAIIDRIGADDAASAGISSLPRPVMLGFLRQLRSRL